MEGKKKKKMFALLARTPEILRMGSGGGGRGFMEITFENHL